MPKRLISSEDAQDQPSGGSKRPRAPLNAGLTLPVRAPTGYANEDYTIGWVCALPTEFAAAQALLVETHKQPTVSRHDDNHYVLGRLGRHNVVLAVMPSGEYGISSATATVKDLRNTFPNIRFCLMVGIGGGAPSASHDIRLGDVVVSHPGDSTGGVFQYDFGKTIQNKAFHTTGYPDQPPKILRSAISGLQTQHEIHGHKLEDTIENALRRFPKLEQRYKRPDPTSDILYQSDFLHPDNVATCTDACGVDARTLVSREERGQNDDNTSIHYGLIASANQLMKDAKIRDKLAKEKKVLCFEMEAAGLMNVLPCLAIRGICDYSDTHKNKDWQGYAAMAAAAYAKDLLEMISPRDVDSLTKTGCDTSEKLGVDNQESATGLENMPIFLNSLRFAGISDRQRTIKDAHTRTCEWLLDSDQYLDWLNSDKLSEHLGFLWIKGKPGAGKSTLMNYAYVKCLSRRAENTAVIAFFFNARGFSLEKNMIGMYRSLLLQLLEKLPTLQTLLVPEFGTADDYKWTVEPLQSMFKQTILGLGQCSAVCFIDALDECDEDQVRDMVAFLERLSTAAVSSGINFRVCFASRPYPNISIAKGLTLKLEAQAGHVSDITTYIETELKIGDDAIADEIRSELRDKASGVFMWACLVIDMLNKTFDKGRERELKHKLREIPDTLHELFRDILTRDHHNKDELLLCIQWVLFAKQPLSPIELYSAILSGTASDSMSQWQSAAISVATAKRFILDASKGLVESTISDTPTVQFIHESVIDFLVRDNGLSEIHCSTGQDFVTRSHEKLKNCCLCYLDTDAVAASLADEPPVANRTLRQAAKFRAATLQSYPFLEYAAKNILYHANVAAEELDQTSFLQEFPRRKWMALVNAHRQARDRYRNASMMYILAEQDCGYLIKYQSNSLSCFEIEDGRYYAPIFASLGTSSHNATRGLFKDIAEAQCISYHTQNICEQYDQEGINIPEGKLQYLLSRRDKYTDIFALPYLPEKQDYNARFYYYAEVYQCICKTSESKSIGLGSGKRRHAASEDHVGERDQKRGGGFLPRHGTESCDEIPTTRRKRQIASRTWCRY